MIKDKNWSSSSSSSDRGDDTGAKKKKRKQKKKKKSGAPDAAKDPLAKARIDTLICSVLMI